jgi:ComF family protein
MHTLQSVIDFALPPRCAGCGVIVLADRQLCVACWNSLDFLTGQGCQSCNLPMADHSLTCAKCLAFPPQHDGVRATVAYGGIGRDIAIRLKHGRRTGLARLMANAMERGVPEQGGLLIPVPLHRWRIWRRGFNQSALIVRHLARAKALPWADDVLIRTKATPTLQGLSAADRSKTVRAAFAVPPEKRAEIKGQTILLVDDVYTSGATANACARTLKRAGAGCVIILCWARVLLDESFSD